MSALSLCLVIAAAVCHASWNFCIKRINGGPELIWLFSALSVLIYGPVAVWVLLDTHTALTLLAWAFVIGSAALHLAYLVLLQTGYRKGDLSLVYPVARATGPILSSAFAVLLLGEHITPQMGGGAAIIIFGVFMLTGGIKAGATRTGTSLGFGLGAGLLIGSYTAWDAYTVAALAVPPVLLEITSNIGRTALLAPIARQRKDLVRQHWQTHKLAVITIAVLNPLAYILVLYAMRIAPVTYVAPIRELSVLLTVLAGSLILGEGHLRWRLTWAAVIFGGITLLASA
ncbi:DMT family transporter [Donghicola mangrovi]|uniref:EamA family transporter n=1 Tax=Donghicola mangrovi TaxID=2729614 RepID=A0A850Q6J1_9RHOB|nr:DMT family transporter [Donghicola mangrovi]NVO22175.1 EamA family transporter [Donghicola mangrovi]